MTMPITPREAKDMDTEAQVIQFRLSQRYSRDPSKRKEARLEMDYADRLERIRPALTFLEFSPSWIRRQGTLP